MQVGAVGNRRPLVAYEGGELAGLIGLFRGVDLPLPVGLELRRVEQLRRLFTAAAVGIRQGEHAQQALAAGLVGNGLAQMVFANGPFGCAATYIWPRYSEWSVTAQKSRAPCA
jgi:hypothetical protein